jgi:hypothetical protein
MLPTSDLTSLLGAAICRSASSGTQPGWKVHFQLSSNTIGLFWVLIAPSRSDERRHSRTRSRTYVVTLAICHSPHCMQFLNQLHGLASPVPSCSDEIISWIMHCKVVLTVLDYYTRTPVRCESRDHDRHGNFNGQIAVIASQPTNREYF